MEFNPTIFEKAAIEKLKSCGGKDRAELLRRFWPDTRLNRIAFDDFSSQEITVHVIDQLNRVRHHSQLFAAQTWDDMFVIRAELCQNSAVPCEKIIEDLQTSFPGSDTIKIRRSVELFIRIWATANVHSSELYVGPISEGDTPIDWPMDISLEQVFRNTFGGRIQVSRRKDKSKFDPATTIAYLVNTCGMRLAWTDDMASHLKFDIKHLELTVYRHKACLISHLDGAANCPIPREVMEEILDTMDLLLPPWDDATNQLLHKEGQQSIYTLGCRKGRPELDAARYQYFGDQLEYIFDAFDRTPRTWKQLALDRRNKLEWSAFWVTVMVAVLTLVSIPCNIIQATYSVKAYNVALAQGAVHGKS